MKNGNGKIYIKSNCVRKIICPTLFAVYFLFIGNYGIAVDWMGRETLDEEVERLTTMRYTEGDPQTDKIWAIKTLPERYSKTREEVEEALLKRVQRGIDQPIGTRERYIATGSLGLLIYYAGEESVPILEALLGHESTSVSGSALRALFAAKGDDAGDYARRVLEERDDLDGHGRYRVYFSLRALIVRARSNQIERGEDFFDNVGVAMREFLEKEKEQSSSSVVLLDRSLKQFDPEYAKSEYRSVLLEEMRESAEREDRREYFRTELQELVGQPDDNKAEE